MNARDFGQRLDQAQQLVQKLASQQESLEQNLGTEGRRAGLQARPSNTDSDKSNSNNKSGNGNENSGLNDLARDQQILVTKTGMLGDLLDRLRTDASTESGGVKQKLDQANSENPPHEIAEAMKLTAEDLQSDRIASASRGAKRARERLKELRSTTSFSHR
jgi:hypothetical protein